MLKTLFLGWRQGEIVRNMWEFLCTRMGPQRQLQLNRNVCMCNLGLIAWDPPWPGNFLRNFLKWEWGGLLQQSVWKLFFPRSLLHRLQLGGMHDVFLLYCLPIQRNKCCQRSVWGLENLVASWSDFVPLLIQICEIVTREIDGDLSQGLSIQDEKLHHHWRRNRGWKGTSAPDCDHEMTEIKIWWLCYLRNDFDA